MSPADLTVEDLAGAVVAAALLVYLVVDLVRGGAR